MNARIDTSWETFPPETLRILMKAIDIDDVVDPDVHLPDPIMLDCSTEAMRRCFALCLQLWTDGFRRADLLSLVSRLRRNGDLSEAERARYKDIRARYKHLRFALSLYGIDHRPTYLLDYTIRMMGNLQDAFRNGRPHAVKKYLLRLRVVLAMPFWMAVRRRVMTTQLDTADGFIAYRKAEILRLKELLEQKTITGEEFHAMRKIVSGQVSFYDTLRALTPNPHDTHMSRFLAAINGLMGNRHDEMVAEAISDKQAYHAPAALDPDIRQRLETFVARYSS